MMIEKLELLDQSIVLFANGLNNSFFDSLMWIISGKLTWFPFYLCLIILFNYFFGLKKGMIFVVGAVLSIALADLFSVHLFKNVFLRYRPSHNLLLMDHLKFHVFENGDLYRGGTYGFVSSHAANFAAILGFSYFVLKNHVAYLLTFFIFIWAVVAFSRMYLGVHYLSDVIVGGLLGLLIAYVLYKIFHKIVQRIN